MSFQSNPSTIQMVEQNRHDIWINGRTVLIRDIVDGNAEPFTPFEKETFSFIKEWLSLVTDFDLQTSGSTGTPKIIKASRQMMKQSAALTAQALGLQKGHHALVALDTRYIAGKMMLVRSLEVGMKIFAVDPCANPLIKIPVDQTIHFAALVPYQAKAILDSNHPHLLDTLLTCIIGGAPVEENLHKQLQGLTNASYITYGMTETVSHIALQRITAKRTGIYRTLPGVTVRSDERNCLVIRAPFLEGEIVTNDVTEVISETEFRWIGRIDNIINSGGIKVSAELLEEKIGHTLRQLHIPNRFFIYSVPDIRLGQKVVMVIESPVTHSLLDSIKESLIHSFSSYEIPRAYFQVDSIILTNTIKVNRQESFKRAVPIEA